MTDKNALCFHNECDGAIVRSGSPSSSDYMVSPSGNYTWTSSGIYYDTITNVAGCDNVITIVLTYYDADTNNTGVFMYHAGECVRLC